MNNHDISFSKIKEFLENNYLEDVSFVLKHYPILRSVDIDYNVLKKFDPDLSNFLLNNPKNVLNTFQRAIKYLADYKLEKQEVSDSYILFSNGKHVTNNLIYFGIDNVPNFVDFRDLNNHVGKLVVSEGYISEIKKINGLIDRIILKPGKNDYRELDMWMYNCSYREHQNIDVSDTIQFTGVPKVFKSNNKDNHGSIDFIDLNHINNNHKGNEKIKHKVKREKNIICNDITVKEHFYLAIHDKKIIRNIRNSPEYKDWVNRVLTRNDSTCVICGEKRSLHTHHLFSFINYPDYRLNPDNGVVLCRWCHLKYHDIYGKETANPVSFIGFLKECNGL
ncbi:MAG: hypothetical protein FWH54_05875 [Methanobrevibacter sp.]|nr:hypothetical protein [Methanobrevibacter sp.]